MFPLSSLQCADDNDDDLPTRGSLDQKDGGGDIIMCPKSRAWAQHDEAQTPTRPRSSRAWCGGGAPDFPEESNSRNLVVANVEPNLRDGLCC